MLNASKLIMGIMQGRLTPSMGRGIQFFPRNDFEWENEFPLAAKIGLSHIEWVWDTIENPLTDPDFRKKVRTCISKTGIAVRGVDLQFLTRTEFSEISDRMMHAICEAMADIHGVAIETPLLEGSTLLDQAKRDARIARLKRFSEIVKEYGLSLNLETDLPPAEYGKLLEQMQDISVVYDSGNSSSMGYDVAKEWDTYASRISNVQIKDRPKGGSTVPLGMGDTDFKMLFKKMKEKCYTGLITLQAAREEDGLEAKTIRNYIEFVKNIYESV